MKKSSESERQESLDKLLGATFDAFGLEVEPAVHAEARFFVGVIADAAAQVQSVDLGDRAEPATVYRP